MVEFKRENEEALISCDETFPLNISSVRNSELVRNVLEI